MSTIKHTLDPDGDWIQLTSGNQKESVLVQVISGAIYFCKSDSKPLPDADAHVLSSGPDAFISISTPTVIWVKGIRCLSDSIIVVTE
ncbi:hypothetical protein NAE50_000490 [Salmonella enterica]|nr:hypothetical protein [Salmonella enterica]ELX2844670.1 hypothetical protein [Salmonella enterica]